MKTAEIAEKRLSGMLVLPEKDGSSRLTEVVKTDIAQCLENYFIFSNEDFLIKIENEGELITLKLMLKAEGIKPLHYLF